jgi:hypothetical protein
MQSMITITNPLYYSSSENVQGMLFCVSFQPDEEASLVVPSGPCEGPILIIVAIRFIQLMVSYCNKNTSSWCTQKNGFYMIDRGGKSSLASRSQKSFNSTCIKDCQDMYFSSSIVPICHSWIMGRKNCQDVYM